MNAIPMKKSPLSPDSAVRLLDLLCKDDEFRVQFQQDPSAALVAYALQPVRGTPCAPLASLASKGDFQTARSVLQQSLTRTGMFTVPHFFEAGSAHMVGPAIAA